MAARPMHWLATFMLAAATVAPAQAGVYRCKQPDGSTVFQDSECPAGAEVGQKTRDTGPKVDLTQPMEKRFRTPAEKARVDAAITVIGLQMGLKATLDYCQKYAAEGGNEIQALFASWRNQYAVVISASEALIEKYTTTSERVEAYSAVTELMARNFAIGASVDPARNASNCKAAPVKVKSFLANRYTDVYATVEKGR